MPKSMIDDQYLLATNPETAPEILRELSQSDDRAIRQAVAGNPNVPIEAHVGWAMPTIFRSRNDRLLLYIFHNLWSSMMQLFR
jgi:hypothetical protein